MSDDQWGGEKYWAAVGLTLLANRASTSFVQRHLALGYNAAARLMDRMQDDGVVSKPNHVGMRKPLWRGELNPESQAARIAELQAEVARLTAELAHFTQSGIVEIAVRNPSVMGYMRHWETRAETAEAENARLRDALALAQYGLSWGKANLEECGVMLAPPITRALDANPAALEAKP